MVMPGAGTGSGRAGENDRFSKYVPGIVNPRGVGTESGLGKTSIETVVGDETSPGGNVMEARVPKALSFTVPPADPIVPSGVREGFVITMVVGKPSAWS
jgi:hypothetical protein